MLYIFIKCLNLTHVVKLLIKVCCIISSMNKCNICCSILLRGACTDLGLGPSYGQNTKIISCYWPNDYLQHQYIYKYFELKRSGCPSLQTQFSILLRICVVWFLVGFEYFGWSTLNVYCLGNLIRVSQSILKYMFSSISTMSLMTFIFKYFA